MGRLHQATLLSWSQIGKLAQQIAVGPYFVFRHISIREEANKNIERIVGECPAVIGKRRRARRVVRQNIWEQCPCHTLRLSRRISTGVLKSVGEAGNEASIVRGFTREVGISLFDQYDRLCSPGAALHLDPSAEITLRKGARPQANFFSP